MAAIAKANMDPLVRQSREVERRRERDADRTKRILHARTRLYGIDTQYLAQQVKEKQDRQNRETQRDMYYDNMTISHSRMIQEAERQKALQRRVENEELNYFRKEQEKEKKQTTLVQEAGLDRAVDFDSTIMKFQGEDPYYKERVKAQQKQQKDWLAQQISIARYKEAQAQEEQANYNVLQSRILGIQEETSRLQTAQRKAEAVALRNYHESQASEKKAREKRDRQMDQSMNDRELKNALSSHFLNEDAGGHVAYAFKGFNAQQRQMILDEQNRQREKNVASTLQQKHDQAAYDREQEEYRRIIVAADREKGAQAHAARMNLRAEHMKQAKEKTLRQQYLDNVVYTNPVKESYFDQFGRSCR